MFCKNFIIQAPKESCLPFSTIYLYVVHFSRSGCFGTGYFYACMDTILLKAELKSEVANLLEDMHGQGDIKKK